MSDNLYVATVRANAEKKAQAAIETAVSQAEADVELYRLLVAADLTAIYENFVAGSRFSAFSQVSHACKQLTLLRDDLAQRTA